MISGEGLTVEFGGTTLFKDISFQINEKDRIALMGKNGAGKTTTIRMVTGLLQPTDGDVFLFGEKIKRKEKARQKMNKPTDPENN